jgi:hypothetical protein
MRPGGLFLVVLAFAGLCLEADAAHVRDRSCSPQAALSSCNADDIDPAVIDASDDDSNELSSGRKIVTANEPVSTVRANSAVCRARHRQDDVRRTIVGPPLIYCLCVLLI